MLNNFFEMDHLVQDEMFQLKTSAQYKLCTISLKSYCSKNLIIQSFNTQSLIIHLEDVLEDPNILASHIPCFNETKIRSVHLN